MPPRRKAKVAKRRAASLTPYEAKRDFARTDEPRGGRGRTDGDPVFVVQMHAATRLHYDLRLQIGDVLQSWAVTRGPSLDPKVRRLCRPYRGPPARLLRFRGHHPQG